MLLLVEANVGMDRNDGSDSMEKPVGETGQTEQTPTGLSRISCVFINFISIAS